MLIGVGDSIAMALASNSDHAEQLTMAMARWQGQRTKQPRKAQSAISPIPHSVRFQPAATALHGGAPSNPPLSSTHPKIANLIETSATRTLHYQLTAQYKTISRTLRWILIVFLFPMSSCLFSNRWRTYSCMFRNRCTRSYLRSPVKIS